MFCILATCMGRDCAAIKTSVFPCSHNLFTMNKYHYIFLNLNIFYPLDWLSCVNGADVHRTGRSAARYPNFSFTLGYVTTKGC